MYVDQWAYKSQGLSRPFFCWWSSQHFTLGILTDEVYFKGYTLLGHDAWRKIQEYSPKWWAMMVIYDGTIRKKKSQKNPRYKTTWEIETLGQKSFPPLGDMKKNGHQRVTYVFTQMRSSNTKKGYLPLEGVEVGIFFIFHLHSEICRSPVTNVPSLKRTFSPLKIGRNPKGKEWVVFQASILRCELWVSKRAIPG